MLHAVWAFGDGRGDTGVREYGEADPGGSYSHPLHGGLRSRDDGSCVGASKQALALFWRDLARSNSIKDRSQVITHAITVISTFVYSNSSFHFC